MPEKLPLKANSSLNQKIYAIAALLVTIIAIKYIASALIAPILIAAMFAVLMMPLFYFFKNKGISPNMSLLLMVFSIVFSVVGLIYVLQYSFTLIKDSIGMAMEELTSELSGTGVLSTLNDQFPISAGSYLTPEVVLDILNRIAANFGNIFLYFIVIPVLAVLLVSQIDSFSDQFKAELDKSGPGLARYRKFADSIKNYIVGRFKVNLATSILVTLALFILGIDYPLLWGTLTLILCFIPYIGIFIAGAGPFMIALGSGGAAGALILALVYTVITSITENIIDPLIQGKQNRLTTSSLIIGFIFWSWLFGILGAIIAAPLTVMLKTILEDYDETKWIALLMVGDYSKAPKDGKSFGAIFKKARNKVPFSRS